MRLHRIAFYGGRKTYRTCPSSSFAVIFFAPAPPPSTCSRQWAGLLGDARGYWNNPLHSVFRKMAAVDVQEPKSHPQNARRKRRKERLIKQGYRRSERDDARRVAARAFLLGIPLDRHLQPRTGASTSETNIAPRSPGPLSVSSRQSRNILGEGTSLQTGASVSELSGKLQDMLDTLPQPNPSPSKGPERQFDSPMSTYPLLTSRSLLSFDSHELMQTPAHRRQQYAHTKWHTVASEPSTPGVHVHVQYGFPPLELLGGSRYIFTIPAGYQ